MTGQRVYVVGRIFVDNTWVLNLSLTTVTCLSVHRQWQDLRRGQNILSAFLLAVKQPKWVDSDHCCYQKQTKRLPEEQTNLIVREIFRVV